MFELTGAQLPQLGHRRAIVLTLAAIVTLLALVPAAAHASGCGDEWTNTAGGSWFVGANWSKGAPPKPEEQACIEANGTYTVTMTQTGSTGTVSLERLTVGGTSGTQTLVIGSSCSVSAILSATAGIITTKQGVIVLTDGESCASGVTMEGVLKNAGTISSEPAAGGARKLPGFIENTGTLAIDANTELAEVTRFSITSRIPLGNSGAIDLAGAARLFIPDGGYVSNLGSISATGSGGVVVRPGAYFAQFNGTTSGAKPVVVDGGTLEYNGSSYDHGSGPISMRGSSYLSGDVRSGELLAIESTCSEEALAQVQSGFFDEGHISNGGTIELTEAEGCGNPVTLRDVGPAVSTFTNHGVLAIEGAHGAIRSIEHTNITNEGIVSLAAGEHLTVERNYLQTSAGKLRTYIANTSDFGSLSVSGILTFGGTLAVHQVSPFEGSLGQSFGIATSSNIGGDFATEIGDPATYTGLYYKPSFSESPLLTLTVTQATATLSPNKGLPGSSTTLAGADYGVSETVTLTFIDSKGVKTVLPAAMTNNAGELSSVITIPASAAPGPAEVKLSTPGGIRNTKKFTVT